MTVSPSSPYPLADELRAVICGLVDERSKVSQENPEQNDGLWRRIETCAQHIAGLSSQEREEMKPMLLALLDELHRTIAVFDIEHRHIAEKLRSSHRNMAADAAYQQANTR